MASVQKIMEIASRSFKSKRCFIDFNFLLNKKNHEGQQMLERNSFQRAKKKPQNVDKFSKRCS